jgi:uncharacterized protein YukE
MEDHDELIAEPVDLEALVQHVARASEELEAAWARALGEVEFQAAQTRLQADWSSFITAISRIHARAAERLEREGVDTRVSELPPFSSEVSALSLGPDSEQRFRQAQMAELLAFEHLVKAVAGLLNPSDAEQWQPAGFGEAKERAGLLARLTRIGSASAQGVLGGEGRPSLSEPPHVERLRLARLAWSRGDPEASVLHLHIGGRLLLADLLDTSPRNLPDNVAALLAGQPGLGDTAAMLALADQVVREAAGAELDLGVCSLLVPTLADALARLSVQPPLDALRAALGENPDHDET